jgi:PAS domain S-box-containing protein
MTESVVALACRIKRVTFCPTFFLFILLVFGFNAGYAHARTQSPNPLEDKNVLILNAFESNVPAFEKTNQGLSAALQSGGIGIRNQFYEHLDLARNFGPENRRSMVELVHQRYSRRNIDFIITLYPEALKFLLDEGQGIFSDAPVLALYLPQGFELPATGRRIIPHLVIPDLKRTLEIALKLVPKANRVYVVGGNHLVDRWLENIARQDFKTWEDRLEFRYLSDLHLDKILATVAGAPSNSIVLITSFGQDVTGKYQTTVEVSRQLARVSEAPIFGFLDTLLGRGIVGGSLLSFEYIGTKAGEMVLDILRGTRYAENIPFVLDVPQLNMFDWRQLRHWNLDEGALPDGSIVINKEITLWDFKYYVIGGLAFIFAQSFLIAGLLMHRRRRRSAEKSLHQKTEELDQFFNISLDLLCIANTDGYFLRLNPPWEKVLGFSRQELMAKRFLDFVHPDDLVKTQEAVSTLASQGIVINFENRYRSVDGTFRRLEWTATPAGNLIYAAARDVTARRLAELALEERLRFEQLLSELSARFANIVPDGVDSEIEYGLRLILEFFKVDRAGLLRTLPGRSAYQITHAAYGDDVPPVPVKVVPMSNHPWAYEKLILKREVVAYSSLDDLPLEAKVDKKTWSEWGIRSTVNIPILVGDSVDHIIVINSVKRERVWQNELFPRLQLLGELFVNALERRQDRLQLEERFREIENLKQRLENENIYLQEEIKLLGAHTEIVGQSLAMKKILAQVEQVAPTDSTVLIQGETGTGKELLARAIHTMSSRKDRPMITVNCASLPPTLIESELFGRERGAYTGALTKMVGRFEVADGSTLFLDEIGEIPQEAQAKLLRVLEEGRFERLGSTKSLQVNVRIIAATNRDIAQDVTEGKFRKDLYYRLNVFPISIPPLRERPEDIPQLVWAFIKEFEKKVGKRIDSIPKRSMDALQGYSWPGNVRELRNVIEHDMIVSSGKTLAVNLPQLGTSETTDISNLESIERKHLLDVLKQKNWRIAGKGGAAECLGLKRTTLQSLMKRLGIERPTR